MRQLYQRNTNSEITHLSLLGTILIQILFTRCISAWYYFNVMSKSLLEVKNLSKAFNGLKAVDNVSFSAKEGEIFGLLGPNGAGKTTTIRTIATILDATDGTAIVNGHDIKKEPQKVQQDLGMLTTEIGVYDRFSGRENLEYFGNLYGLEKDYIAKRIDELIELLDMKDFIDKKAGKYSTGMKQKLAIARAVIHDPEVLILDEPTAGLDVLASQTVLNFMKKSRELGKCVILSTHVMNDAERLCDRVAIMHKGKIITVDTVGSVEKSTNTENLEDAFMALIKKEDLNGKKVDKKIEVKQGVLKKWDLKKVLRITLLVAVVIQIIVMFLLNK